MKILEFNKNMFLQEFNKKQRIAILLLYKGCFFPFFLSKHLLEQINKGSLAMLSVLFSSLIPHE